MAQNESAQYQHQIPIKKPAGREIVIGHYRITKTLGQGTFGKVKEGIHLHTD